MEAQEAAVVGIAAEAALAVVAAIALELLGTAPDRFALTALVPRDLTLC